MRHHRLTVVCVLAGRWIDSSGHHRRVHVGSAEVTGDGQVPEPGRRFRQLLATRRPRLVSTLHQQTHLDVVRTFHLVQAVEGAEDVKFVRRLRFVFVRYPTTQVAMAHGGNAFLSGKFREVIRVPEYLRGKDCFRFHIPWERHLFVRDLFGLYVHCTD